MFCKSLIDVASQEPPAPAPPNSPPCPKIIVPVTGSTSDPSIEPSNASSAAMFGARVAVVTNGGSVVTSVDFVCVCVGVIISCNLDVSEIYGLYPASLGACAKMSGFIEA